MKQNKWFISYTFRHEGFINVGQVITDVHPFVWSRTFKNKYTDLIILSWQKLSEEDCEALKSVNTAT